MAEYDPQRSRPRRRVTDEPGPAPVDEMLDAAAEAVSSKAPANGTRGVAREPDAEPTRGATREPEPTGDERTDGDRLAPPAEVVDLAPAPPVVVERSSGRARALLVAAVVALALIGFALRRLAAARRARQQTDG